MVALHFPIQESTDMKEIRIGILGFGTVGAGVVEGIQKNGNLMAPRVVSFPSSPGLGTLIQNPTGVLSCLKAC